MCVCVCVCVQSLSRVQLFVAPCNVACKTPRPMELSREEYWSRIPFPAPGDLPNPGMEPASLASPVLTGRFFTASKTVNDNVQFEHRFNFKIHNLFKMSFHHFCR